MNNLRNYNNLSNPFVPAGKKSNLTLTFIYAEVSQYVKDLRASNGTIIYHPGAAKVPWGERRPKHKSKVSPFFSLLVNNLVLET